MTIVIISILVCCVPFLVEAFMDRYGDSHKGYEGLAVRACIMAFASVLSGFVLSNGQVEAVKLSRDMAESILLCIALHVFFFPVTVNWLLWKYKTTERRDWWNNMNEKVYPDRWQWYSSLTLFWRQVLLFIPSSALAAPYFNLYAY